MVCRCVSAGTCCVAGFIGIPVVLTALTPISMAVGILAQPILAITAVVNVIFKSYAEWQMNRNEAALNETIKRMNETAPTIQGINRRNIWRWGACEFVQDESRVKPALLILYEKALQQHKRYTEYKISVLNAEVRNLRVAKLIISFAQCLIPFVGWIVAFGRECERRFTNYLFSPSTIYDDDSSDGSHAPPLFGVNFEWHCGHDRQYSHNCPTLTYQRDNSQKMEYIERRMSDIATWKANREKLIGIFEQYFPNDIIHNELRAFIRESKIGVEDEPE